MSDDPCTCIQNDPTVSKLMGWLIVYDKDGIPDRMGDEAYEAGFRFEDIMRLQELFEAGANA